MDDGCFLSRSSHSLLFYERRSIILDRFKDKRYAFCRWYLTLGNVREAALRAGCPPDSAADDGLQMLHSAACRRYLAQLANQPALPMQALVTAGLVRLAFGDANDAAKLAFAETVSEEQLRTLDLFHVTSIRHDKNGFEIKLADRLSAMTKLLECANAADTSAAAAALLQALRGNDGEGVDCDDDDARTDGVFSETA